MIVRESTFNAVANSIEAYRKHEKVEVKFVARAVKTPKAVAGREPPALNVEDRFDQLVSLAVDLAEERLRDKSASNQLISEIIRYGSTKERLMKEKIQRETEMLRAKAEALHAQKSSMELYERAIEAMKEYAGYQSESVYGDEDDDEDY